MLPAPYAKLCHVFPSGPGMRCGREGCPPPPLLGPEETPPCIPRCSLCPELQLSAIQIHDYPHVRLLNRRDVENMILERSDACQAVLTTVRKQMAGKGRH